MFQRQIIGRAAASGGPGAGVLAALVVFWERLAKAEGADGKAAAALMLRSEPADFSGACGRFPLSVLQQHAASETDETLSAHLCPVLISINALAVLNCPSLWRVAGTWIHGMVCCCRSYLLVSWWCPGSQSRISSPFVLGTVWTGHALERLKSGNHNGD